MGSHPINLILRFLLELTGLYVFGMWGYVRFGLVGAFVFSILAASIWGVFNVPNDPSRSGKAPIRVTGLFRLLIECLFFSTAVWTWHMLGNTHAWALALIIIVHYAVSYDRVIWLLKN